MNSSNGCDQDDSIALLILTLLLLLLIPTNSCTAEIQKIKIWKCRSSPSLWRNQPPPFFLPNCPLPSHPHFLTLALYFSITITTFTFHFPYPQSPPLYLIFPSPHYSHWVIHSMLGLDLGPNSIFHSKQYITTHHKNSLTVYIRTLLTRNIIGRV